MTPKEGDGLTPEKKPDSSERKPPKWRGVTIAVNMGYYLVGPIFGGLFLGYLLDRWLGTRPWLTVIMLFLGIAVGLIRTIQLALKMGGE